MYNNPMMITTLLFDLDGTLFDSTTANAKAYGLAFRAAGVPFEEQTYRAQFGLRFQEMMDSIAPDTSPEVREKIRSLKATYYRENIALVKPNYGLIALLRTTRAHHKTGLVTTASRGNVRNLLSHFSIESELFDTIITGDEVTRGKPDPECYTLAINKLGVLPKDCCIFEDSDVGVAAATKAGAQVIRIVL